MPRVRRVDVGGMPYHLLNRSVGGRPLFLDDDDGGMFMATLRETAALTAIRVCALCVMQNHWHLVVWPKRDGQVSAFAGRFGLAHTQRHHARHRSAGQGHLYQARYRSFPVEHGAPFLAVWRYVERNPVRAGLVERAHEWLWSSAFLRRQRVRDPLLAAWPVLRPRDWASLLERKETPQELEELRVSAVRSRPYGSAGWVEGMVRAYGLETTIRSPGRPRRQAAVLLA